jgi:probable DNA repair protein
LNKCASAARGKDQKIFASAAISYQSILDSEDWIDEAGLTELLTTLIDEGQVSLPDALTFAGFDRFLPDVARLLESVRAAGTSVAVAPTPTAARQAIVHAYENSDAELRAAGAWARKCLQEAPDQVVGIVVTHLEQDADRSARLIREGFTPGWQTSGLQFKAAVNVSYGRRLSSYPAIAIALTALRWLESDLGSRDVSTLLRTPAIGVRAIGGRARLELALRQVPHRNWSPAMILGELERRDKTNDARDWIARISVLDQRRAALPRREAPSKWALLIDEILKELNWPGEESLNSVEFQLLNRWKELLNDLARLEPVAPAMTLSEVLARVQSMASETVFQPESEGSVVQVLGSLEAAGMQFDRLWISGLSAANWPPQGRPSPLVSRSIQREYGMPDATPDDTLQFARRVLQRLRASAAASVCSYPLADGDAEQSESGLLADVATIDATPPNDPGWHARLLVSKTACKPVRSDPVPVVTESESVWGGAATIQRQFEEPLSAFVFGRLGIRPIPAIYNGLAASLRGNLIHSALQNLYSEFPSRTDIDSWNEVESGRRVTAAVDKAFWRHKLHADSVLQQLFELEQQRVAGLLHAVISLDRGREEFVVVNTEGVLDTAISGVQIGLRVDRIDRLDDGSVVILDYKTGTPKQFLDGDGEPKDMQLIVYACAVRDPVAGLGLVNIDSRSVGISGAGPALSAHEAWDEALANWKRMVEAAAADLQQGDVRIDGLQSDQQARALALVSRIRELRHAN